MVLLIRGWIEVRSLSIAGTAFLMRLLSIAAACGLLLSTAVRAQGPAPGPAPAPASAVTVGFMHAIHATNEVEKTLAFYRDVFGVSGQVRDFANQAVPILTDSPGVTLKVSMLQPAGARLQLRADAVLERRAPRRRSRRSGIPAPRT